MVVVLRNETALLLADPFPVMIVVAMPLVLVVFLAGGLVEGAVTAVPGLSTLFGFLGMSAVGTAFFRDHGWNTWTRLRASGASPIAIVIGKSLVFFGLFVFQQAMLLFVGWAFLGMPWRGNLLAGAAMVVASAAAQVSLGILVTTYSRTFQQMNAITNLGGLLLAGVGSAFAPVEEMPGWLQAIAPVSPLYWALQGIRGVIAHGWGVSDVATPAGVLVGISVLSAGFSALRYRHDEQKVSYV